MKLTNSTAMRDADNEAIHVLGIPSTLLMTNAANALADAAREQLGSNKKVVLLCGIGNNGGDGVCAAALLLRTGCEIHSYLVGNREKMTPDCAEMERRLIELGGTLEDFDPTAPHQKSAISEAGVIIDAMFGIGLNSELKGKAKTAAELINASDAFVISADIASGIEADTGSILGSAVKADMTVTFSMAKIGHFTEPGCTYCGALRVVSIGIPEGLLAKIKSSVSAVTAAEISLPKRKPLGHKGSFGKLLIIGGSVGYSGAAALCATAAARSGVGTVSLGVPNEIYTLTASKMWEVMCFPLADEMGRLAPPSLPSILDALAKSTACVLGCGLSRSDNISNIVLQIVDKSNKQLVIDADGLYALGAGASTVLRAQIPPILTPHDAEFTRLGGVLTDDRIADAVNFAKSRNCILVLKGHRVICAFPDGEAVLIAAGNSGMAKGGSGDVLAGIIGGLVCQMSVKQAVVTACLIHAEAGDLCKKKFGEYAMLPTDLIATMGDVMKEME